MTFFIILVILFISGIIGVAFAELIMDALRALFRKNEKRKMKNAIQQEMFYNELYEETLYEELDDIARRAEEEMWRRTRRK